MKTRLTILTVAFAILAIFPGRSNSAGLPSISRDRRPKEPAVSTMNVIGDDEEVADFQALANHCDVKIVLDPTSDAYIGANVAIFNSKGQKILEYQPRAGWFWSNLPKGTYTAIVNTSGREQKRQFTVSGSPLVVTFFKDYPST